MPDPESYPAGVPCWVDTSPPDPRAAADFYSGLFGWECEDVMPPGSPVGYFIARLRGGDVAAIGGRPEGDDAGPAWSTYVSVDDADATASRVPGGGGAVLTEPMDVFDAGRMAVFADREGAEIRVWQPGRTKGAQIVNEHGSVNFNNLRTSDPDAATAFYGAVFGCEALDVGGPQMWRLPGYGEFLERSDPGLRERMAQTGAPEGFADVVAALHPIGADEAGLAPQWTVTFAVDDADQAAARAAELGGRVLTEPIDAPWVRMAVISDPQGASFIASQFVPENRDLAS